MLHARIKMINYLKGRPVEIVKLANNRLLLILEVDGIGYEIQIPARLARDLQSDNPESIQIFTDLQIREDRQVLYGFLCAAERDLFRQLISVSGIGAQGAIASIDTLGLSDLVSAIVTGNVAALAKTPGVGKKTAERIALELKTKLAQWRQETGAVTSPSKTIPSLEVREDVEMTLLALGYTSDEIDRALGALSNDNQLVKNSRTEDWIRSAIAWLSDGAI